MVKDRVVLALLALVALGVYVADVYLTPDVLLPAAVYAIPIFIAVWLFPPRPVAAIAVWTSFLEIAASLEHPDRGWLFAIYLMGIAFFGILGVALSHRVSREKANADEARESAGKIARLNQEAQFERARWQATVEAMLDPVAVCDAQGSVTYINPAYERHIGYLVPKDLPLELHPRYYQLYRADGRLFEPEELPLQRAALSGEEVREVEVVERTADGREFTAVFNASPLHDAAGRIVGAVAVGRDVTERKRQQAEQERLLTTLQEQTEQLSLQNEELQSQSEELQLQSEELHAQNEELLAHREQLDLLARERATILESIADAIFVCDERGLLTLANRAGLQLLGEVSLTSSHTLATYQSALQLRFRDGRPVPLNDLAISRALVGETIAGREEVGVHPASGGRVDLLISAAPLRDGSGRVVGAVEVATDVTRIRQAERELRESEGRLRTMADAIPQLAWMAHPDGFIYWYNRRWYEYTGTTPEQMEGWGWQGVHDPEMLPEVLERWKASIATGEPFEMDFPLKGADGRFRWFLTRVMPLKDQVGRVLHWFGTNTDISGRKEAEEERERLLNAEQEARARAEKAVRIRNEFLSVAAHELKTPVTSLKGFAQVIVRRHAKTGTLDPDQVVRAMTRIDEQTTRLSRLTDELLDVSRLESGKLKLAHQEVEASSFVEQAVAALQEIHPDRTFIVRDQAAVRIVVDPSRIEQVIRNLLDNAIKFSPRETPLEIDLALNGQDQLSISVRDYGVGVPEPDRERVFERFYQAHPERHYGGMGLGLFISAQIVEMHGGTISCEDPHGPGSLFVVRLPL